MKVVRRSDSPTPHPTTAAVTLADVRADIEKVNRAMAEVEHRLAALQSEREDLVRVERWMQERARRSHHTDAEVKASDAREAPGRTNAELAAQLPGVGLSGAYRVDSPFDDDRPMHFWATRVLRAARRPVATRQLLDGMRALGYRSGAVNEYETVFGGLNRIAKRPDSPIVKIGNKWALRVWYPNGVPTTEEETTMVTKPPG